MTTTTNDAQSYATSLLVVMHELVTAIREDEDYEGQPADEYLQEWPLELVAQTGSPFEILLTFGGPDARIVWDGRYGTNSARLVVRWWADSYDTTSADVRYIASYFEDLMYDGGDR